MKKMFIILISIILILSCKDNTEKKDKDKDDINITNIFFDLTDAKALMLKNQDEESEDEESEDEIEGDGNLIKVDSEGKEEPVKLENKEDTNTNYSYKITKVRNIGDHYIFIRIYGKIKDGVFGGDYFIIDKKTGAFYNVNKFKEFFENGKGKLMFRVTPNKTIFVGSLDGLIRLTKKGNNFEGQKITKDNEGVKKFIVDKFDNVLYENTDNGHEVNLILKNNKVIPYNDINNGIYSETQDSLKGVWRKGNVINYFSDVKTAQLNEIPKKTLKINQISEDGTKKTLFKITYDDSDPTTTVVSMYSSDDNFAKPINEKKYPTTQDLKDFFNPTENSYIVKKVGDRIFGFRTNGTSNKLKGMFQIEPAEVKIKIFQNGLELKDEFGSSTSKKIVASDKNKNYIFLVAEHGLYKLDLSLDDPDKWEYKKISGYIIHDIQINGDGNLVFAGHKNDNTKISGVLGPEGQEIKIKEEKTENITIVPMNN